MAEGQLVVAGKRNYKSNQPPNYIGQERGKPQPIDGCNNDKPMGGGSGAADCNKPTQLPDNILHDDFSEKAPVNTTPDKPKRIVVCADDFGMNSEIDAGILSLAQLGRLSATSCMAGAPMFKQDAPALKASGLQTGLHLNFTEALGGSGMFVPLPRLIMRTYARRLDFEAVRGQIVRQLDAFEDVMGREPDFVDGHQHVHQLPQIRTALLTELAQRYAAKLPWLRYTGVRAQPTVPPRLRYKAQIIQTLGANRFANLARGWGFALNAGFLGVYDFQGGAANYEALLQAWLRHAQAGDVLMCHPASRVNASDGLGAQRFAEFQVLAGESAGGWLGEYGISLGPL